MGRGAASGLFVSLVLVDVGLHHLHENTMRLGARQQVLDNSACLDPQEPTKPRPVAIWAEIDGWVCRRDDPALDGELDLELVLAASAKPGPA